MNSRPLGRKKLKMTLIRIHKRVLPRRHTAGSPVALKDTSSMSPQCHRPHPCQRPLHSSALHGNFGAGSPIAVPCTDPMVPAPSLCQARMLRRNRLSIRIQRSFLPGPVTEQYTQLHGMWNPGRILYAEMSHKKEKQSYSLSVSPSPRAPE